MDQSIKAKAVVKGFLSVDVVDDYTVRVNVDKYQNNFLNFLASSYGGGMVSPTAFEKKGTEWAMWNPVGTGPFKFVSFERGSKLTFTKFDGYWQKGKPYLDGIEFLFHQGPHDPAGGHARKRLGEGARALCHLRRAGGDDEGPGV